MQDGVIRDDMLGISWVVSQTACDRTTTAGGGWRYPRASEAISLVAEIAGVPLQKLGAPRFSNSQRLLGSTSWPQYNNSSNEAWLLVYVAGDGDAGPQGITIERGTSAGAYSFSGPFLCAR